MTYIVYHIPLFILYCLQTMQCIIYHLSSFMLAIFSYISHFMSNQFHIIYYRIILYNISYHIVCHTISYHSIPYIISSIMS